MAVVTISRGIGSGGAAVAERVAEILHYDVVDKELITQVARAAKVPESEVEKYDEQPVSAIRNFLEGLLRGAATPRQRPEAQNLVWAMDFPYHIPALIPPPEETDGSDEVYFLDQGEYLRFVQSTVQHLWRRGNVIIVGRGAQMILAGLEDTLHVRITASEEFRAERIMRRGPLSYREALEVVRKSDRRRAAYLRRHYHVDWDDPGIYHLVINAEQCSEELAVAMIVAGVHRTSAAASLSTA